ncbi:hypothetical protein [Pseudescherichia vulneris]|uniref:hypothetical protein n=1 Tax=Pseudescherichia vulneris TaxID=566 RepID=UPI0030195D18
MKERDMIFNSEMVRAILDGRKTQTRRLMTPQPTPDDFVCPYDGPRGGHIWPSKNHQYALHVEKMLQNGDGGWEGLASDACHFGEVGDRIWVREAFRVMGCATDVARLMYKASERNSFTESTRTVPVASCTKQPSHKWTPSIHMPRWASRLTLEITDVRVERLKEISEADARAEGIERIENNYGNGPAYRDYLLRDARDTAEWFSHANRSFLSLWHSIYGGESLAANPWVWVIEFKRVDGGTA